MPTTTDMQTFAHLFGGVDHITNNIVTAIRGYLMKNRKRLAKELGDRAGIDDPELIQIVDDTQTLPPGLGVGDLTSVLSMIGVGLEDVMRPKPPQGLESCKPIWSKAVKNGDFGFLFSVEGTSECVDEDVSLNLYVRMRSLEEVVAAAARRQKIAEEPAKGDLGHLPLLSVCSVSVPAALD